MISTNHPNRQSDKTAFFSQEEKIQKKTVSSSLHFAKGTYRVGKLISIAIRFAFFN
jgi:hypothetical protein